MKVIERLRDIKIKLVEKDILECLQICKRWPHKYHFYNEPSVELIDSYGMNMQHELYDLDTYLNYPRLLSMYEKGFTILLANILDIHSELRKVENILIDEIGHKCWANLYFSKGGAGKKPSFDSHKHPYDVAVKQIYGTSPWIVGDKKFKLKPNDVVYIPKETYHQVTSIEGKKLSLTINLT
jgi:mannose-6-phosphate isomerase-like protein (cupin superfamily)